jgi:hypothetical protein
VTRGGRGERAETRGRRGERTVTEIDKSHCEGWSNQHRLQAPGGLRLLQPLP